MTGSQIFMFILIAGVIIFILIVRKSVKDSEIQKKFDKGEPLKGKDATRFLKKQGRKKDIKK